MKKINFKKIITTFLFLSFTLGCNVVAIPTIVTKDISMGVILINNLQDKNAYYQEITVDLSNFISDDQFNDIDNIKFKKLILTLNSDYLNSVTNAKNIDALLGFFKLKEGIPFTQENFATWNEGNNPSKYFITDALAFTFNGFTVGKEAIIGIDNSADLKNYIKDKKIKVGFLIATRSNPNASAEDSFIGNPNRIAPNFNDNSFSFIAKVETEVLIVQ